MRGTIATVLRPQLILPNALDAWQRLVQAMPGDEIEFKPDLSWLEAHSAIVYPLVAIVTVGLLVVGILGAWRSDDMSGILKVEYKREIIVVLRKEPGGVPIAGLAKRLKLSVHRTAVLTEEMVKDGQIAVDDRKGVKVARIRFS